VKEVQNIKRSLPDGDYKSEDRVQPKGKDSPQQSLSKIRGNALCPCGAVYPDGKRKKYKHCCGK